MKIYIASPYSHGDIAINVRLSILAAEKIREKGHLPFVPLLSHLWQMISPHDVGYWMGMDKEWVLECDGVLRLPGESEGADEEVRLAMQHGKKVYRAIREIPDEGCKEIGCGCECSGRCDG